MEQYFASMLIQLNNNKLQEADMYQLYQDMVNTGYAWSNPEISYNARLMIQKNLIKAPANYVHREVTVEEVLKMQESRQDNKVLN